MQRRAVSREALLDAFSELVLDRPYAMISLSDLYEAAGVSKGQFYSLFTSREAAAVSLARSEFDKAHVDVGHRCEHFDPSLELLIAAVFESTAYLLERPRFHAAVLLHGEIGRSATFVFDEADRWREFVRTQVVAAVSTGDVAIETDPDHATDFIVAAWTGVLRRSDAAGLVDVFDSLANVLRFVVAAIVLPDRRDYLRTFVDRYAERLGAVGDR